MKTQRKAVRTISVLLIIMLLFSIAYSDENVSTRQEPAESITEYFNEQLQKVSVPAYQDNIDDKDFDNVQSFVDESICSDDVKTVPEEVYGLDGSMSPEITIKEKTESVQRYIVKFKHPDDKSDEKALEDSQKSKAKKENKIKSIVLSKFKDRIKNLKEIKQISDRYLLVEIESSVSSDKLISDLKDSLEESDVEYIQPDYEFKLESNDPYYDVQWALYEVDKQNTDNAKEESNNEIAHALDTWIEQQNSVKGDNSCVENGEREGEGQKISEEGLEKIPELTVAGIPLTKGELDMLKDLPELRLKEGKSFFDQSQMSHEFERVEYILNRPVMPHEIYELKRYIEKNCRDTVVEVVYGSLGVPINSLDLSQISAIGINAVKAWELTQGEGSVIAIIDTGVDYNHEDLTSNIFVNTLEIEGNGIDDDCNGYIDDVRGWSFVDNNNTVYDTVYESQEEHGTHIAGIIAGIKDNEKGIVGAAPKAKVMILKAFRNGTAFTSDIIEAIHYAEKMGVRIVNCSFASGENNPALEEVIKNSNILFVCSAGNYAGDMVKKPVYPAAFDCNNIISVAAINRNGHLSASSNYGDKLVDIAAPGEEICSTLPNNQYGYKSGTSMATAYVSAEAALLLSKEAVMNIANIKEKILGCTDRLSSLMGKVSNGNNVNYENALKYVKNTKTIDIPSKTEESSGQGSIAEVLTLQSVTQSQQSVAAAQRHSIIVKNDGTVWTWGHNGNGQLGDGTITDKSTPVQVSGLTGIVSVETGCYFNLALKSDGTVWAWGDNRYGQLGDGTTVNKRTAVQVGGLAGVVSVAAGVCHSLALKSDGTVWAWGHNSYGQLGDGTTIAKSTPVQVVGITGVVSIAAGDYHSLVVKNDGTVWVCGRNDSGQLGDGTTTSKSTLIQVNNLTEVKSVAGGYNHSLAAKNDGTVWTWGDNYYGQLGDGTTVKKSTPVQVSGLTEVKSVAGGYSHSLALKSDGTVWAWGGNSSGQFGDGTTISKRIPVQASGVTGVISVAAGDSHSLALKSDGTVWAWGQNWYGQLGEGAVLTRNISKQVIGLTGIISVAAGKKHSLVLKSNGTVWAWGFNQNKQLGNGTDITTSTPVQVSGITGVASVSGGDSHSLALKSDGTVWAWGYNGNGELGTGTTALKNTPVQVVGLTEVIATAVGNSHSLALKSDGTVWAWGYNGSGQLGDGTAVSKSTPVQVSGLTEIVSVAAGDSHSLAIKSDGTVWAWGSNRYGQLGDGTTVNKSTPVKVSGITGVASVAGGYFHSLALKSDGTVWAWGHNSSGQLGDGTTVNKSTPIQISGLAQVVSVAAGDSHNLAVKSDKTVWAWGLNYDGQLGNSYNGKEITPVQVSSLTNITCISAGNNHSIFLNTSGITLTTGNNTYCQLGDRKRVYFSSTPIKPALSSKYEQLINSAMTINQTIDLAITGYNISVLNSKKYTISYDSNQFELIDLCATTAELENSIGGIQSEFINVSECSNGRIVFLYTDNTLETEKTWSGLINLIKFKSKINGQANIRVTIE